MTELEVKCDHFKSATTNLGTGVITTPGASRGTPTVTLTPYGPVVCPFPPPAPYPSHDILASLIKKGQKHDVPL